MAIGNLAYKLLFPTKKFTLPYPSTYSTLGRNHTLPIPSTNTRAG